jgi:hypothetical protein
MLEFKVRTGCCLHPVHLLMFASVQRVSSSIPTVLGDRMWRSDSAMVSVESILVTAHLTAESQLCIESN